MRITVDIVIYPVFGAIEVVAAIDVFDYANTWLCQLGCEPASPRPGETRPLVLPVIGRETGRDKVLSRGALHL